MRNISVLVVLLFFCFPLLSQTRETTEITKEEAIVINRAFDHNRKLRELSVMKDSLINDLQKSGFEKSQIITKQTIQIKKYNMILLEKDSIEANYVKIMEKYEKNRVELEKSIKREKRKKNFWKYSGLIAVTASITALILK